MSIALTPISRLLVYPFAVMKTRVLVLASVLGLVARDENDAKFYGLRDAIMDTAVTALMRAPTWKMSMRSRTPRLRRLSRARRGRL